MDAPVITPVRSACVCVSVRPSLQVRSALLHALEVSASHLHASVACYPSCCAFVRRRSSDRVADARLATSIVETRTRGLNQLRQHGSRTFDGRNYLSISVPALGTDLVLTRARRNTQTKLAEPSP